MFATYKIGAKTPSNIHLPLGDNTYNLTIRACQAKQAVKNIQALSKASLWGSNFITKNKNAKWSDHYRIGANPTTSYLDTVIFLQNATIKKYGQRRNEKGDLIKGTDGKNIPITSAYTIITLSDWLLKGSKKVGWGQNVTKRKRNIERVVNNRTWVFNYADELTKGMTQKAKGEYLKKIFLPLDIAKRLTNDFWQGCKNLAMDLQAIGPVQPWQGFVEYAKIFWTMTKEAAVTVKKSGEKILNLLDKIWDVLKWAVIILAGGLIIFLTAQVVEATR